MPTFTGISHVALTVTDPERSAAWYAQVLGLERRETVRDVRMPGHDIIVLVHPHTDIAVNLHVHPTSPPEPFDERRTGLDHVSFLVAGRTELEQWKVHLDTLGVAHSGIADELYGCVLVLRDPDNIQLELFANPPT